MASVHRLGHVCPFGSTPMATICAAGIRLPGNSRHAVRARSALYNRPESQQQPVQRDHTAGRCCAGLPSGAGCVGGLLWLPRAHGRAPVHVDEEAPQLSSRPGCSDGICTDWADKVLCSYQYHRHLGLPLHRDLSILHPPQELLHCVTCIHAGATATSVLQPLSSSNWRGKARSITPSETVANHPHLRLPACVWYRSSRQIPPPTPPSPA